MSDIQEYQGQLMTMDYDTIDSIIDTCEGDSMFVKLVQGGFMVSDRIVPELVVRIIGNEPYWMRWVNNQPEKLELTPGQTPPEGYELRTDLTMLAGEQQLKLSLSKTSVAYQYKPYLIFLKQQKLTPADVLTKLRSQNRKNAYGSYQQVTFEMVETVAAPQQARAKLQPKQTPPPPPPAQQPQQTDGW
jgi:hypothetical protein